MDPSTVGLAFAFLSIVIGATLLIRDRRETWLIVGTAVLSLLPIDNAFGPALALGLIAATWSTAAVVDLGPFSDSHAQTSVRNLDFQTLMTRDSVGVVLIDAPPPRLRSDPRRRLGVLVLGNRPLLDRRIIIALAASLIVTMGRPAVAGVSAMVIASAALWSLRR